ncbi:uncharacterized protein LOC123558484 [Mercenaria mercenaria]|uniref:uncharacterized protein LOC123558484 n=1 Tax=Mercenaria mercenaria TaxID=6596 RepID=UPI00234F54FD|nr:uncharacterized protein LOC123558484 [Mercenaria mercenaria]
MSFNLPLDLETKSYYLTIVADSRNELFEEDENDNKYSVVFDIKGRASTDIAVSNVAIANTLEYEKEVSVSWLVVNNGTRPARGFKCDSVYLSRDIIWDISDAQIGRPVCSKFDLKGNSSSSQSSMIKAKTPPVASSFYNTIVKTRSNLLDLNLDNNIALAGHKTKVIYTKVTVNTTTNAQIVPYGSVAIQVTNVSDEKTLIFNISSDDRDSFNSLYVKGGSPATLFDFEKVSDDPNMSDQIITVSNTMYSNYYILIVNTGSMSTDSSQNLNVTIKYAHFEILDVFPKSLVPGAKTTLHITGTLFPYDSRIHLMNAKHDYDAIRTYIFSSSNVYATFYIPEINNLTVFVLKLTSDSSNETIQFRDKITIKNGTEGYLEYSVENPGRLRNGETGIISVNLQNAGDTDLYVPLVIFEASDKGSVRLIDGMKRHIFKQCYFVFCSMKNGPAGILPPKSQCQLKFETKQNETYRFGRIEMALNTFILRQTKDTDNPYIIRKDILRPTHYDQQAWDPIWSNFIAATGKTALSLSEKLSDVLNEMSLGGRYVKIVDDVIGYLLDIADSPYSERYLVRNSDLEVRSDSEIVMSVERYLSSRIGSRSQVSYMGKGWILPLWDTKIKQVTDDDLILTVEKVDFNFVKYSNSSFVNKRLGVITKTETDLIHIPNEQRRKFHFDSETLALKEISSLVDDSFIKLQYEGHLLKKILHSSGSFVNVMYDRHDRIQTMQLQNSSNSVDNKKLLCAYDLDNGVLSEIRRNGETTRYSYFQDFSLKYIINPDRSMILYEYNKMGHLSAKKFIQNGKQILSREYTYSSGGVESVKGNLEGDYSLTFDENGNIVLIRRKGFLPSKTIITSSTEIQYEGELIVTKRTLSGNMLTIEDGNGDKLQTVFNNRSQLIGFSDGGGNEYRINLNRNGSIRSIIFPDGSNKTYLYSQNGHTVKTQNNGVKKFLYNEKKQLTMKDIGNSSVCAYNYDENGNLLRAENKNGEIEFFYTKNNVKTISYPDVSINYKYNEKGFLSNLSTNKDYFVHYDYNDLNKLTRVTTKDDKVILTAEYNSMGKIVKKSLGNNITTTYSYDSVTGLLRNLTNFFKNGSVASYFIYDYSLHLRRVSVDTHEGKWKFRYDRAGQIVSMTDPKGSVTKYIYDNRKNRKMVSVHGFDYETEVNSMNQYRRYRNRTYSYDKNGNMNFRDGSTPEYFSFDEDNKLSSYKSKSIKCLFEYDALDNLYAKTCNNTTTRYIINPRGNYGSDIIEQIINDNGNQSRVRFYHGGDGIGLIAAQYDNGSIVYFTYGPIGTVQEILNEDGDLLNNYYTDPFGQEIASTKKIKSMFTFVGQWGVVAFEEIPDIYFMRSRMYDSYTGRFFSTDAYGLKAHSKNLYAYCSNNPVHFNDPKGDFLQILVGAAIGSAVGVLDYALSTPKDEWSWGGGVIFYFELSYRYNFDGYILTKTFCDRFGKVESCIVYFKYDIEYY